MGQRVPKDYDPSTGGTWNAVFGGFRLCTSDGKPLVLDRLTYQVRVGSERAIVAKVRSVRDKDAGGEDAHEEILAATGTIGHFRDFEMAGKVSEVAGFVVKRSCDHAWEEPEFDELLVQLAAGPAGAWTSSVTVRYHRGKARYYLQVKDIYGMFGAEVKALCADPKNPFHGDPEFCDKTPSPGAG